MADAIILLIPFFIGAIPTGYIIGRIRGVDLRTIGSGNIGATNAARALGKKAGVITLIGDLFKGLVAVFIARFFIEPTPIVPGFYLTPFFGLAAILGHCYSPFLKCNGGKGVATSLGVFLILAPVETLIAVTVFAANFFLTRIVSLSSLLAAWTLVVAVSFRAQMSLANSTLLVAICTAFVITVRHRANIGRLIRGEEPKSGTKKNLGDSGGVTMGLFVTIEGPEGAGKSTLQKNLARALRNLGKEVVETREPGGTALGQTIRTLLLTPPRNHSSAEEKLDPKSELLLFLVDRAHHVLEVINPALQQNAIVICDRFIHSTLAYQGYGRGMDLSTLRTLNDFTIAGCKPDLVLLLDLDPEKGLERAVQRNRLQGSPSTAERDRFEQEQNDFHERVRRGFLAMAAEENTFVVLDATKKPEELSQLALAAVIERLKKI